MHVAACLATGVALVKIITRVSINPVITAVYVRTLPQPSSYVIVPMATTGTFARNTTRAHLMYVRMKAHARVTHRVHSYAGVQAVTLAPTATSTIHV